VVFCSTRGLAQVRAGCEIQFLAHIKAIYLVEETFASQVGRCVYAIVARVYDIFVAINTAANKGLCDPANDLALQRSCRVYYRQQAYRTKV